MTPKCPLMLAATHSPQTQMFTIERAGEMPTVGAFNPPNTDCIGSECAWWDPKPINWEAPDYGSPNNEGRCGAAKGRNFEDPAVAEALEALGDIAGEFVAGMGEPIGTPDDEATWLRQFGIGSHDIVPDDHDGDCATCGEGHSHPIHWPRCAGCGRPFEYACDFCDDDAVSG